MSRHRLLVCLGAVLLVACCLRVGRWSEERAGILAQVPTGDERTYDLWAQAIAQGTSPAAVPYQAPLPATVMAGFHRALDPEPARDAYRLFGALLGVATCALAFLCGRRLGGPRVGLVAAALTALHDPLIYYEPTLLRDGPATFLLTGAAWLLLRFLQPDRPAWVAPALGLTLGVGALWRENLLLVAVALVVALAIACRRARRPIAPGLLALTLCVGLPLAPVWISNWRLERSVSPLPTWNGGCVFYIANQRGNRGVGYQTPPFVAFANPEAEVAGFKAEAERRLGRPMTPHAVSSYWLKQGLLEVAGEPGLYLRKVSQRVLYALASQEFVHARDLRLDRETSWILRLPGVGFGLLVGFAAFAAWELRRRPEVLAVTGLALAAVGTTIPVAFATRYRLPVVPLVAVLASLGIARATLHLRRGQPRRLLGGLAIGLLLTSVPIPHDPSAGRWSRCLAWLERGNPEAAFEELEAIESRRQLGYWQRVNSLLESNGEAERAAEARRRGRALERRLSSN